MHCLVKGVKRKGGGTSLVVQWLGLHTSPAGGTGSIPGQGIKTHGAAKTKKKERRRAGNSEGSDAPESLGLQWEVGGPQERPAFQYRCENLALSLRPAFT